MQHHLIGMFSLRVVFMMQRRRVKLSVNQRSEMWCRWKAGQSLHEIGRAFGKSHVVIHFLLARHGGIAPAARRRSQRTLTLAEREDLSRGIAGGSSIRQIAKGLQRAVAGRWPAMAGGRRIEPTMPIGKPGSWPCGPRPACWLSTSSYERSLRVN